MQISCFEITYMIQKYNFIKRYWSPFLNIKWQVFHYNMTFLFAGINSGAYPILNRSASLRSSSFVVVCNIFFKSDRPPEFSSDISNIWLKYWQQYCWKPGRVEFFIFASKSDFFSIFVISTFYIVGPFWFRIGQKVGQRSVLRILCKRFPLDAHENCF